MNYQNILLEKVAQLESKATTQVQDGAYYEMLIQLAKELMDLVDQVETLKQETAIKNQLIALEGQWLETMDELCESFDILADESFGAVKGKKIYETVDEIIADLEDWIENVNEVLEDKGVNIAYLEAWDIGVFFE